MAVEKNRSEQRDVCVVYDESVQIERVDEIILKPLKDKRVTCYDIQSDLTPGELKLENMFALTERSKCILIIHPIQKELLDMLELVCSNCTLSKQCIPLSFQQGHERKLSDIIVISKTSNWLKEVLRRMASPAPIFCERETVAILCKIPQSASLFNYISNRNISSIDMNILGIHMLHSTNEIKLDLTECIKNIESHETYKTDEVLENVHWIRSTQVELRIDPETVDMTENVSRVIVKIFSNICGCVLNVGDRKHSEWILVYILSGPQVLSRNFMSRLYHSSRHAVIGKSFTDNVHHPDFADEQMRKKTFKGTVLEAKATSMAEAGFFSDGLIDRSRCYYCGGAKVNWKESDEPWRMHAKVSPRCSLVEARLSKKGIEEIVKTDLERIPSGNPDYESFEKRKSSLDRMLMTQSSRTNDDDKEKFISDVAEAGFYYVGPEDRVGCFSCGVVLSGIPLWTSKNLLKKHACVSPSCAYVKEKIPSDKIQYIIDTMKISSEYVSACFFIKTFDRDPSSWPRNMLS